MVKKMPKAKKAEPKTKKAETKAKKAEPKAKKAETKAKKAEPKTKKAKPKAKKAKPKAKKAKPKAKKAKPKTKKAKPKTERGRRKKAPEKAPKAPRTSLRLKRDEVLALQRIAERHLDRETAEAETQHSEEALIKAYVEDTQEYAEYLDRRHDATEQRPAVMVTLDDHRWDDLSTTLSSDIVQMEEYIEEESMLYTPGQLDEMQEYINEVAAPLESKLKRLNL